MAALGLACTCNNADYSVFEKCTLSQLIQIYGEHDEFTVTMISFLSNILDQQKRGIGTRYLRRYDWKISFCSLHGIFVHSYVFDEHLHQILHDKYLVDTHPNWKEKFFDYLQDLCLEFFL